MAVLVYKFVERTETAAPITCRNVDDSWLPSAVAHTAAPHIVCICERRLAGPRPQIIDYARHRKIQAKIQVVALAQGLQRFARNGLTQLTFCGATIKSIVPGLNDDIGVDLAPG